MKIPRQFRAANPCVGLTAPLTIGSIPSKSDREIHAGMEK